MSASSRLRAWLRSARWRRGVDSAATLAPWAVVIGWAVGRCCGSSWGWAAGLSGLALTLAFAWRRALGLDTQWLLRRLNALRSDMDDSADLLFAREDELNGLQRLQQTRLRQRIETAPQTDLRPPWSRRRLALSAMFAALALAAIALWPAQPPPQALDRLSPAPPSVAVPGQPRLTEQSLRVDPPAYTGLPPRNEPTLEGRVAEASRLRWTLRFQPQPAAVALVFHDGQRLPLQRDGDNWSAQRVLLKSALYRIEAAGASAASARKLYRIDVTADRPPQLRVLEPERGLTLLSAGQKAWPLNFEASDDYGVAADARLRITLAQGSGENITFREQFLSLRGSGPAKLRRYAHRLDLAALGFAVGDDLIVQLQVQDNRAPTPQIALSPSLILRWPADLGSEATGVEGLVKTTLPAYFRSQRQIIIDAEALIAQQRKLDAERFVKRSDEIGVDQRLLRLRYGQFLGEEAEGEPKLPTNDSEDAHAEGDHAEGEAHANEAGHDDHDHGSAPAAAPVFGQEGSVLEQYGHTHDHAEAATLLDPETRKLLKAALDQMWQSELHLRQGHPRQALPYAYKALGFIKQVQQASRIYLARVGPELPPIDETRRLSGKREGLARRGDELGAATAADPTLAALWRDLEPSANAKASAAIDYTALERWLREHDERVPDPLAFAAALSALREQPDCASCRARLRALLWPLLPRPAAAVRPRDSGDALDRRYFEALQQERR
ncbi:hypothetical protein [Pseudomonas sp. CGJS7]|uniref:hypothetical protein n=1 Tax=Pseudomonas sp. CGJS7 TaxID=3109348 RepID=UPI00300A0FCC